MVLCGSNVIQITTYKYLWQQNENRAHDLEVRVCEVEVGKNK